MRRTQTMSLVCFGVLLSCGSNNGGTSLPREAWNNLNDPIRISPGFVKRFVELPLSGAVLEQFHAWSDSYWPTQKAGIAARWYQAGADENNFLYAPPSENAVRVMTVRQLAKLSPAEKYDIFMGRFDYPTVQSERRRTRPDAGSWEGICHGWVAATMFYPEPTPVVVKGPSEIAVPFGSSDVKALLSYFEGVVRANAGSRMMGVRCNVELGENTVGRSPECRDTNAGAFHVFLTNQLGIKRVSFAFDQTVDSQVWNQPAISYSTKILSDQPPSTGAARGTVREVNVQTELRFALEIQPMWDPVVGTRNQLEESKTYKYRLELDAEGNIIGGEWLQADRPDFMWLPVKGTFLGYWAGLGSVYRGMR